MQQDQPLVFIPGLFETPHIWQSTIDRLELPAASVAHLHLVGHRPEDTLPFDLDRWVDEAVAVIDRHGAGRPVTLVCHSTGGLLGLILARRMPEKIESLVLVGSLSCGHRDRASKLDERLLARPLLGKVLFAMAGRRWLRTQASFQRGLRSVTTAEVAGAIPEDMRLMLKRCNAASALSMTRWVLNTSIIAQLPEITVPILAMIGQRDSVVPPSHQLRMMQAAPMAQACLMDAAHMPFLENPTAFDQALTGWLQLGPRAVREAQDQEADLRASNAFRAASTAPRLTQVQR
ncbi:alpha/beta fold hydrolase [Loktanella agnita]|uniref:alpha/beta fold hydrolase n=1 Tax=Loktanella agnita TaxID=287097 RepID=UPI00398759DA